MWTLAAELIAFAAVLFLRPRWIMAGCERLWKVARSVRDRGKTPAPRPEGRPRTRPTPPPPVHPHQDEIAAALVNLGCKKKPAGEIARAVCQGNPRARLEILLAEAVRRASTRG